MRQYHYMDVNKYVVAIAALGGVYSTEEILNAPTSDIEELENLKHVVSEVVAGRAVLVLSEDCLEMVRRILVRGASNFEAIDEDSAAESVTVLWTIADACGGIVSEADLRSWKSTAAALTVANVQDNGKHDEEDDFRVATVLAYLAGLVEDGHADVEVKIHTNDKKLGRTSSQGVRNGSKMVMMRNYKVRMVALSAEQMTLLEAA